MAFCLCAVANNYPTGTTQLLVNNNYSIKAIAIVLRSWTAITTPSASLVCDLTSGGVSFFHFGAIAIPSSAPVTVIANTPFVATIDIVLPRGNDVSLSILAGQGSSAAAIFINLYGSTLP